MWKKLITGLRIVERVREEYGEERGEVREEINPFTNRNKKVKLQSDGQDTDGDKIIEASGLDEDDTAGGFLADESDTGGGFLPDGYDDKDPASPNPNTALELEYSKPIQKPNGFHIDGVNDTALSSNSPSPPTPKQKQRIKQKPKTPKSPSQNKRIRKSVLVPDLIDNPTVSSEEVDPPQTPPTIRKPPERESRRKPSPVNTSEKGTTPKRRSTWQSAKKAVRSQYFEHR